jgi:uncharacterized protein (DUF58 family)
MDYGSIGHTKEQYANTLAATLAYYLYLQGDGVGLLTFDETIRDYLPARHRPGHLRHLMLALERPVSGTATDLTAPIKRIVELVKKRGMMVFISDLLAPIENLERSLISLTASGHEVLLFHVLDPAELRFDLKRAAMLYDLESGRDLYVEPDAIRKEYLRKLEAHNGTAQAICQKLGASYYRFATDRPLELALFDFLRSYMQRGRKIKRVNASVMRHRR